MIVLAEIATTEWQLRRAQASKLVSAGDLPRDLADARLRPWLAIACRCGADLPELEQALADRRTFYPDGSAWASERQLRAMLADDICPRPRWQAVLAQARDEALLHGDRPDAPPATVERARAVMLLAARLIPHIPTALRLGAACHPRDGCVETGGSAPDPALKKEAA